MKSEYADILKKAASRQAIVKKALTGIASRKDRNFDKKVHLIHDEVFESIDCLECGNCCQTLGPRFNTTDIERISKHLRLKPKAFVDQYLVTDEDEDFVFKDMPCPFVDGCQCTIYPERPRACHDYPHTRERNMQGKLRRLTLNSVYCPAASLIAERIIVEFTK